MSRDRALTPAGSVPSAANAPHAPTSPAGGRSPYAPPLVATTSRRRPARRLDYSGMAGTLLDEIAADEDERWGGGRISASAYETAWVALVHHPEDPQRLAYPASLDWLLRHQRRDGMWGPPFPHCVIPSMAALLALRRAPGQTDAAGAAAARGLRALRRVLPHWHADLSDTPFYEFLILNLAAELERVGIHLDVPDRDLLLARREAKLARLPLEALYAGRSSLLHALEVFGPALDFQRLRAARSPGGGYGCSPSATAAVLLHAPAWDDAAARWLRHLEVESERAGDPGAMATSHPADVFEAAWTLHLLRLGGLTETPSTAAAQRHIRAWLRGALGPQGAGFSRLHGLPSDADDTALVLAVLNDAGETADLAALDAFERADHFVSYDGERTASTSTNAHVLDALLSGAALDASYGRATGVRPGVPLEERARRLVRYLLAEGSPDGCWEDKWHLSPYYATLSCALALARHSGQMLRRGNGGRRTGAREADELHALVRQRLAATLAWLARTQRRGGGWGVYGATLEETAYGTLTANGLLRLSARRDDTQYRRMVREARGYLRRHLSKTAEPEAAALPTLWVDKTLYAPPRVIRAAVLSALHRSAGT